MELSNNEELLNNQIKKLEDEYEKINKKLTMFKTNIYDLENRKKEIVEEVENTKEKIFLPILIDLVKKIDTNNLLSNDEIKIIYQGMDKSDYSNIGITSWLDVDKLVNRIITIKNKYPIMNFTLFYVKLTSSEDRYPPNNYYSLTFTDSEKISFTIN